MTGAGAVVDLRGAAPGRHLLRLTAEGTRSRYPLSWTEDAQPLTVLEPAFAEVPLEITGTQP